MSDTAGKAIVDPTFDQVLPFLATELAKPVIDLVDERGGPEVPDDVLVQRYREQRKEWGLESYRCEVLAPLVNFESEIERLAVGDRLQLATMTPEFKTKLAPLSSFLGPPLLRLEMVQSCVRANYVVTRGESIGVPDDLREDLDLFLTALRLLKSGAVVYGEIYSFCVDKPGSGIGASGGDWSRIGASYELKQDDSAAVLTVFDNLKQGKQEQWLRQLRIALGRFSDSYERRRPEDKLIDWTIALESTLLAGVETELKYRLSLRGATLLRGRFDPYWTQSILQAMYDARSGIVHSGKTLADIDAKVPLPASAGLATISQLPEMAEKVTRTIILEYLCLLRPGMTIKKINADLDRKIIAHLGK